jgi:predicted DNA-binding transcriptional regulator AlpA
MKKNGGLLKPNPKQLEESPTVPGANLLDDLMTEEEVMKKLGVKKQWLADHRTRVQPIIPHIPMGREIRYPRRAVDEWLASMVETRPNWERKEPSEKHLEWCAFQQ